MLRSYNLKYNNTLSFVQSINIIDTTLNLTWYGIGKEIIGIARHYQALCVMCPLVVTLRIYNLKLTKQHVKKQQQQININMIKNIYIFLQRFSNKNNQKLSLAILQLEYVSILVITVWSLLCFRHLQHETSFLHIGSCVGKMFFFFQPRIRKWWESASCDNVL